MKHGCQWIFGYPDLQLLDPLFIPTYQYDSAISLQRLGSAEMNEIFRLNPCKHLMNINSSDLKYFMMG